MEIKKVTDEAFRKYGQVLEGYDFSEMVNVMKTPGPVLRMPPKDGDHKFAEAKIQIKHLNVAGR